MTAVLLALLLLQGTPAPKGIATGIVRSAAGAPAAGVRVYAVPAGDPNTVSVGAMVFESIAETDVSGRYRLEISAGRYFIAVGSVASPTYYPDTPSVASAKAISIAAGGTVENVDFSRFVIAASSPAGFPGFQLPPLPPGSTGVLSGVVRAPDGSAASGITVAAVPISLINFPSPQSITFSFPAATTSPRTLLLRSGTPQQVNTTGAIALTDSQGRYRFENVSPDTYQIVAGFSDSPVFYPGTRDSQLATSITTTPATSLTTLDFTMPPLVQNLSVRGRIAGLNGLPSIGAALSMNSLSPVGASTVDFILPEKSYTRQAATKQDGTFELADISPGKYTLQARLQNGSSLTKTVELIDHSEVLDFDFSKNVLSGRIVLEDGSPFTAGSILEIAVTSTSNPNLLATTVLSIANDGGFVTVMDPGDYRFYLRRLPDDYTVLSMTSGTVDLTKETIHVVADVPGSAEIRVAKVPDSNSRVRGRVLDVSKQRTSVPDRIEFCCFPTPHFERLSTTLRPDGSFEFSQLTPGRYTATLRSASGQVIAGIVNQLIDVGTGEKSGLTLVSSNQVAPVSANVTIEGGATLPSTSVLTVALAISPGTTEEFAVPMARLRDGSFWTPFPTGVRYSINVTGVPAGYRVKSMAGVGSMSAVPTLDSAGRSQFSGFAPGEFSIVLERIP